MHHSFMKALIVGLSFLVSFPVMSQVRTQDHADIEDLKNLQYSESNNDSILSGMLNPDDIRLKEMRNTALSIGAQNGYVDRINELKIGIERNEDHLDRIYDFSVLMRLSGDQVSELFLLPPVISEAKNISTVSDSSTRIRISDTLYNIDIPGRLVTTSPNWRQYLIFDQPVDIMKPVRNLLPKNREEKALWSLWIEEGWEAGIKQAEKEMSYRVRKLGQDFVGMTRYMRLAVEKKVNRPVVSSSVQGVTGGGSTMRINDRTVQLSVPATLDSDDNNWEALVLDNRGSLRYEDEQENNIKKNASESNE